MSRLTPESIERVRLAADMVEVVSGHTELRRRGTRYLGLCPFHDERTPSFSVDPVEKLYYCFGCQGHTSRSSTREGPIRDAVEQLADTWVELETSRGRDDQRRRTAIACSGSFPRRRRSMASPRDSAEAAGRGYLKATARPQILRRWRGLAPSAGSCADERARSGFGAGAPGGSGKAAGAGLRPLPARIASCATPGGCHLARATRENQQPKCELPRVGLKGCLSPGSIARPTSRGRGRSSSWRAMDVLACTSRVPNAVA
jgi:hypothetical protein